MSRTRKAKKAQPAPPTRGGATARRGAPSKTKEVKASRGGDEAVEPVMVVQASTHGLPIDLPAVESGPTPAFRIRSAEDLLADKTVKLPKELLRGLLHQGTRGVLAGASKSGKSWALLDLGMSVATGTPWLNVETAQGRVLYVNYEIMEAAIAERVRNVKAVKVEDFGDLDFSGFDIANMRGKTAPLDTLINQLLNQPKAEAYSLLLIDPLYKAIGGGKESNAAAVERLAASLSRLEQQAGTAVLMAHHYPKGKQTGKSLLDRISGSVHITRDLDTAIGLTEHKEKDCLTVEFDVRNFAKPAAMVVERRLPRFIIREDLEPPELEGQADSKREQRSTPLLDLLGVDGLTASDWQEKAEGELKIPRATFFRDKKELVKKEMVLQDSKTKRWKKSTERSRPAPS